MTGSEQVVRRAKFHAAPRPASRLVSIQESLLFLSDDGSNCWLNQFNPLTGKTCSDRTRLRNCNLVGAIDDLLLFLTWDSELLCMPISMRSVTHRIKLAQTPLTMAAIDPRDRLFLGYAESAQSAHDRKLSDERRPDGKVEVFEPSRTVLKDVIQPTSMVWMFQHSRWYQYLSDGGFGCVVRTGWDIVSGQGDVEGAGAFKTLLTYQPGATVVLAASDDSLYAASNQNNEVYRISFGQSGMEHKTLNPDISQGAVGICRPNFAGAPVYVLDGCGQIVAVE